MRIKLNEPTIRKLIRDAKDQGTRIEVADADCRGLRLRITPNVVTWVLGIDDSFGTARRHKLGAFPEMGLSDARKAATALKVSLSTGATDPTTEKRRLRQLGVAAADGVGTLTSLLDTYAKTKEPGKDGRLPKGAKSWPEARRRIEDVFKVYLRQPLASLTVDGLQATADGWKAPYSASAAVRYLRPVLKWAGPPRKLVPMELATLRQPRTSKKRERFLNEAELSAVLQVLRDRSDGYARALRFMLLTLARRDEACTAVWRDIDLSAGVWHLPRTKSGRAHAIPLSTQAIALLGTPGNPGDLLFLTTTGAVLGNWDRETKKIMKTSKTGGWDEKTRTFKDSWHRHDLRRTGATLLGKLGEPPHVIEAVLNHKVIHSELASTYNLSRYIPEATAALQRLGDHLDEIGKAGDPAPGVAEDTGAGMTPSGGSGADISARQAGKVG